MWRIVVYEEHYYDFIRGLPKGDRKKIQWVIKAVSEMDRIPANYLKYLSSPGIYEIRTIHNNIQYRICCCFDRNRQMVLLNAFSKRTRRTPQKQIRKAIRLYKKYHNEKERS